MVSQICLEELETRPSLNCRSDGRNFRTVSRCVFGAEKSLVWVFQESDKFMVLQQESRAAGSSLHLFMQQFVPKTQQELSMSGASCQGSIVSQFLEIFLK